LFLNEIYTCTAVGSAISGQKAIPLQVSTGPEGSRRVRVPDFYTIGT
jgi:hypothetical protein